MKFSLLALAAAVSAQVAADTQPIEDGPIEIAHQPDSSLKHGHVRLDVNVAALHEQFADLAAHQ